MRLKTIVDFVGDTLGHTVRAAAVKAAAASAAEEASRQLRSLVQTSAEALHSANRQVTAEVLKSSLQPQLVQIKNDMMEKVGLVSSFRACDWHPESDTLDGTSVCWF